MEICPPHLRHVVGRAVLRPWLPVKRKAAYPRPELESWGAGLGAREDRKGAVRQGPFKLEGNGRETGNQ